MEQNFLTVGRKFCNSGEENVLRLFVRSFVWIIKSNFLLVFFALSASNVDVVVLVGKSIVIRPLPERTGMVARRE